MRSIAAWLLMVSVCFGQYGLTVSTKTKEGKKFRAYGTASYVGDSLMLSCNHVLGDDDTLTVKFAKDTVRGKMLFRNEYTDFAIIALDREPKGETPIKVGVAAFGETVKIGGFAGDLNTWKYQTGIIAKRGISFRNGSVSIIAKVLPRPGDSGGPVLNGRGELVGVIWGALEAKDLAGEVVPDKCAAAVYEFNGFLQQSIPDHSYWKAYASVRPYHYAILYEFSKRRINQLEAYIIEHNLDLPKAGK